MHRISNGYIWRTYPGICLGIRSKEEYETFAHKDDDDKRFTIKTNMHILMLPFVELGWEFEYVTSGYKHFLNFQRELDEG